MKLTRRTAVAATLAAASFPMADAAHASAAQLALDGQRALDKLYALSPRARYLGRYARAILIFPSIIKGAFVFGAQTGNGVLLMRGQPAGYYNISAGSFGLQAGGQAFSSAMFFMNERALAYLHRTGGFAIGSAPNIVVVDQGAAADVTSTTVTQDVYVFPFAQRGLMAGIDIHGSKITRINPD
jgi:lipid-binding SYLF domain-containing protein